MAAVDMVQTGKNIESMMKKRGMTARDMQEAFGLATVGTVYTWLRGKKIPCIDNIVQMADLFGVRMDDIVAVKRI